MEKKDPFEVLDELITKKACDEPIPRDDYEGWKQRCNEWNEKEIERRKCIALENGWIQSKNPDIVYCWDEDSGGNYFVNLRTFDRWW